MRQRPPRPRPAARTRLLGVTLAAALTVPVVVLLPVTTAPTAAPHPVRPKLQQFPISGIDAGVALSLIHI